MDFHTNRGAIGGTAIPYCDANLAWPIGIAWVFIDCPEDRGNPVYRRYAPSRTLRWATGRFNWQYWPQHLDLQHSITNTWKIHW